jgi:hypothetical protein
VNIDGTLTEQIEGLVKMAQELDGGYERDRALDRIQALIDSDAALFLAKADLVKSITDAESMGVMIDHLSVFHGKQPVWWEDRTATTVFGAVAAVFIVSVAMVLIVAIL